jgi:hypothetical protein
MYFFHGWHKLVSQNEISPQIHPKNTAIYRWFSEFHGTKALSGTAMSAVLVAMEPQHPVANP